mmetsp:Transcript_56569/g.132165  ORF Transcript_56569/g.132165 Transcript_56569/m.132165 type:complete len:268 (-) Transcript_56569:19-822(-)
MQKDDLNVFRFLPKHIRIKPSHSRKSTSMGGNRGTIFTTMESTSGGGVKFIRPTLQTQLTFTKRLVLTARRPYWDSPTLAISRSANSFWNMSTAHRKAGRCANSLKVKGDEIWYGKFATQTSKIGHFSRNTSFSLTSKLFRPAEAMRLRTSAAMRGSISQAMTFLQLSTSLSVRFPVPGPISKAVSLGFRSEAFRILSTIPGFRSRCWPNFLLVGTPPPPPPPPPLLPTLPAAADFPWFAFFLRFCFFTFAMVVEDRDGSHLGAKMV